jgi:hypothetical protein
MITVTHLYLYQATQRNSQTYTTFCCVQYESHHRENFRSYDSMRTVCWHTTIITANPTAAICFCWWTPPKHVAAAIGLCRQTTSSLPRLPYAQPGCHTKRKVYSTWLLILLVWLLLATCPPYYGMPLYWRRISRSISSVFRSLLQQTTCQLHLSQCCRLFVLECIVCSMFISFFGFISYLTQEHFLRYRTCSMLQRFFGLSWNHVPVILN